MGNLLVPAVNAVYLASMSDPTKGAALVGYDGSTVSAALNDIIGLDLWKTVDTVAEMQALSGTTYPRVMTRGYTTAGDGRGGNYVYSSTSTAATDNTIVFYDSTNGTGRYLRDAPGSISVTKASGTPTITTLAIGSIIRVYDAIIGDIAFYQYTGTTWVPGGYVVGDIVQPYSDYIIDGAMRLVYQSPSISTAVAYSCICLYVAGFGTGGAQTVTTNNWTMGTEPASWTSPITNYTTIAQSTASTGTFATNTAPYFMQRIESVQTLQGKSATFSFWAWSTVAGAVITPYFYQNFGTGGSPSTPTMWTNAAVPTITLTIIPTRYSVRIDIPSIIGKTLGTASDYLGIGISLPIGTTFTVNTGLWQLEDCSTNAPVIGAPSRFNYRGIGVETLRASRYLLLNYRHRQVQFGLNGEISSSSVFPTIMRVTPTIAITYINQGGNNSSYGIAPLGNTSYEIYAISNTGSVDAQVTVDVNFNADARI